MLLVHCECMSSVLWEKKDTLLFAITSVFLQVFGCLIAIKKYESMLLTKFRWG